MVQNGEEVPEMEVKQEDCTSIMSQCATVNYEFNVLAVQVKVTQAMCTSSLISNCQQICSMIKKPPLNISKCNVSLIIQLNLPFFCYYNEWKIDFLCKGFSSCCEPIHRYNYGFLHTNSNILPGNVLSVSFFQRCYNMLIFSWEEFYVFTITSL